MLLNLLIFVMLYIKQLFVPSRDQQFILAEMLRINLHNLQRYFCFTEFQVELTAPTGGDRFQSRSRIFIATYHIRFAREMIRTDSYVPKSPLSFKLPWTCDFYCELEHYSLEWEHDKSH